MITFLTIISGALEGIGVALIVPVIGFLIDDGKRSQSSNLFNYIIKTLDFFHLTFSMESVLGLMIVLFMIKAIISVWTKYVLSKITTDFSHSLQVQLFNSIPKTRFASFQSKNAGELVSSIINDPQSASYALNLATTVVANIILVVVYSYVLFLISLELTVITGIAGFVLIYPFRYLNKLATNIGNQRLKESDFTAGRIIDFITKIKFYLASKNFSMHSESFEISLNKLKRVHFKNTFLSNLYGILSQPFTIVLVSLVLISSKKMMIPFDLLVLFIVSFIRIPPMVFQVQGVFIDLQNLYPSFEKIMNLIAFFEKNSRDVGTVEAGLLPDKFDLSVKNLDYYIGNSKILNRVNVELKSQKIYFIMGESGSGKSTFMDILIGLRPEYDGQVLVNGLELKDVKFNSWKQNFSYVTQDPIVWNDTVESNILEYSAFDQNRYEEVIQAMGCDQFIKVMPEKDKTIISDTALNISGGQKQRLALSRAFYSSSRIVLLDEVTSSLDAQTEKNIVDGIRKLAILEHKTVFFITHRTSFINSDDNIMHFRSGVMDYHGTFGDWHNENK
ncbi:MAG: ABC transporter ATP-binding protein [Bacteriovorax sp.]|nr:ABC transporter ATP-binding protein [Bacteriovorax sp.]